MIIAKATCKRMEIGRLNWIEFEEFFLAKDLNQIYEFVEHKKYWHLIKIEIFKHTNLNEQEIDTEFTSKESP